MKNFILVAGILLSMSAMASGERQSLVRSSALTCDGKFNITDPTKNILFPAVDGNFDSSIFEDLELTGETDCTDELLNQIKEDAVGSFGFVPSKVVVRKLVHGITVVTVSMFVGADTVVFTGVK